MADATLAAVDYLGQTTGAVAAARLLTWGGKLSFLQEMLLVAAAAVIFAFMFFFIFATLAIA